MLDTHALIWWLGDDPALSGAARDAIGDADEAFVSAASAMEVVTGHRLGKLPEAATLARNFEAIIRAGDFIPLAISLKHAALAGGLRIAHEDPFDRFSIAQSLTEAIPLVSNERVFDGFGVIRDPLDPFGMRISASLKRRAGSRYGTPAYSTGCRITRLW